MSFSDHGNNRKRDVYDKVKAIKAQQEKWMKEKRNADNDSRAKERKQDLKFSNLVGASASESEDNDHGYNPAQYESRPMSSKDFNSKADEIISRVKSQLAATSEPANRDESSERHPSAHICPNCHKLMVSPRHNPIMLIPCGHNFCLECCRDIDFCYMCSIEVSNQTNNVMLEQVIVSASPTRSTPSKSKPHIHSDSFDEQRQNFLMRREALEEEKCNIERNIDSIHNDIQDEQHQIAKIEKKEAKVLQQIAQLQKEMAVLQAHKSDYRNNITSHEGKILSRRQKLDLIDQTVLDIEQQIQSLRH